MVRLDSLTGWRGVAAYSVLVAHAMDNAYFYGIAGTLHGVQGRLANFGMSLFFVLSGFVIQYNYAVLFAKVSLGKAAYHFFVARFARLYPLYVLTLIIGLSYVPSPHFAGHPVAFLTYITLTQSWFNTQMATLAPAWSISSEWFFYFAFIPLTMMVVHLRRPIFAMVTVGLIAVFGLGTLFGSYEAQLEAFSRPLLWHGDSVSADLHSWLTYFSPLARLPEFIMGMLAAQAFMVLVKPTRTPFIVPLLITVSLVWILLEIFVPVYAADPFIGYRVAADLSSPFWDALRPNFVYAPASAALLFCCCYYDTLLGRVLSTRPLIFVGEISYSVYLWSFLVIDYFTSKFASSGPSALAYVNSSIKLALAIFLTTILAYGSYLLVELPARRWLRLILAGDKLAIVSV